MHQLTQIQQQILNVLNKGALWWSADEVIRRILGIERAQLVQELETLTTLGYLQARGGPLLTEYKVIELESTSKHYTRNRVAVFLMSNPKADAKRVAEALQLSRDTANYHLKTIRAATSAAANGEQAMTVNAPAAPEHVEATAPSFGDLKVVQPLKYVDLRDDSGPASDHCRPPQVTDELSACITSSPAPIVTTTRFALWSTGELVIEQPEQKPVVLTLPETRALVAYLDRLVSIEPETLS